MKAKWQLVLFVGLILLLASSVAGCLQPSVPALPVITEFRANPTEITSGESAGLFWGVSGATTVTIDQDIGDMPEAGTQSVSPTTTTTYILRATNDAGRVTKSVVITVIPPMEDNGDEEEVYQTTPARFSVTNLSISPSEVEVGGIVVISCVVLNSGGTSGTYAIVIKSNGTEVMTQDITLDAGEDWLFFLSITAKSTGTHIIEIDDLKGTYTVVNPQVIKDLAYIKISASGYTDDADPEYDGISARIIFYDSKSERIAFENIPVTVTIELYGYYDGWKGDDAFFKGVGRELVYEEQFTVDHSELLLGAEIRIPFETIEPGYSEKTGGLKGTVTTPEQGSFEDNREHMVPLYAE